jgi:hypothetical protein
VAEENRKNKQGIDNEAKRQAIRAQVDVDVNDVAPPMQQIYLLTEILKEIRIIRERL